MRRLISLAMALIVCIAITSRLNAQPTVSWSTAIISAHLLPGTIKLVPVTFRATRELDSIDLSVGPALERFVAITPSHFESVPKNTRISVSILFSVAKTASPKTFDGVLQVRSGSGRKRVLPKPLPLSLVIEPTSRRHILVDSSRDGGLWWCCQSGPFDPTQPHQGKRLADFLRSLGMDVTELPRPFLITSDLLSGSDLVLRPSADEDYSDSERQAYRTYIENGGGLVLLAAFEQPGSVDALAELFGVEFKGFSLGDNVVSHFRNHPITEGVTNFPYFIGSGVFRIPEGARILGSLDQDTFIDLNGDFIQEPGEPSGAPVMGIATLGAGTIFFMGSTLAIEGVPRPLVDNLVNFFLVAPCVELVPDSHSRNTCGMEREKK